MEWAIDFKFYNLKPGMMWVTHIGRAKCQLYLHHNPYKKTYKKGQQE